MKQLILFVLLVLVLFSGCFDNLDNIKADDCDSFEANSDVQIICLYNAGINELDTEICDRISTDNLYFVSCYAEIAIQKGDISVCEKLKDVKEINYDPNNTSYDSKDACYQQIAHECSCAHSEENKPACTEIKKKGIKGACE